MATAKKPRSQQLLPRSSLPGLMVESVGEIGALVDGTPFFEVAEFSWCPPGPGSYKGPNAWPVFTGPVVWVRLVLRNGHAEVEEVRIARDEDDVSEVSASFVNKLPLKKIVDEGTRQLLAFAHALANPGFIERGDRSEMLAALQSVRESVDVARRHRRVITDEVLRKTAKVYRDDTTGMPTKAVADSFPTSHRNATRYVALARKAGLLPAYGKEEE
jgi:hypothetical protein